MYDTSFPVEGLAVTQYDNISPAPSASGAGEYPYVWSALGRLYVVVLTQPTLDFTMVDFLGTCLILKNNEQKHAMEERK